MLGKIACLASALVTAVAATPTVNRDQPLVDLGYVKYAGVKNSTLGVNSFLGIHYAAPPVGDLRWRAPVPIEKSNKQHEAGYIDATGYGPQCVQASPGYMPTDYDPKLSSEDCLLMNILTPSKPASSLLPVVVDIHGGGYIGGNSTSEDGTLLVNYANGSIIYISIQYRLGAYGFLAGSDVAGNGIANAGLYDQRLALEWVQEHIEAFGGDPRQVTIYGGSAGGGSVIYQLTRGGGELRPPFRTAVPEFPGLLPHHNLTTQDAIYAALLEAANCTSLQCLRDSSYEDLFSASQTSYRTAYDAGFYGYGDFCYTPVVDGTFVKDLPSKELASGHFSKVPILVDANEFEGIGFTNLSVTTSSELHDEFQQFWPAATPEFFPSLDALYPLTDFGESYLAGNNFFQSPVFTAVGALVEAVGGRLETNNTEYWRSQAMWGDYAIHCPSRYLASAAFNQTLKVPVWKLRFNAGYYAHGAAQSYILGNTPALIFNTTLSGIVRDWYLSFFISEDPNFPIPTREVSDRPWFPQYGAENDVMQVNETGTGRITDPDASGRCNFFLANAAVVRN